MKGHRFLFLFKISVLHHLFSLPPRCHSSVYTLRRNQISSSCCPLTPTTLLLHVQ